MFDAWIIGAVAFGYLLFLFVIARIGDVNRPVSQNHLAQSQPTHAPRTIIYPLSLAIYCTTWTFFGSVGLAVSSGLSFIAIYLGPILLMVFGHNLLKKIISLSKRQRITSVADFLGARYGKSIAIAALATLIAVIGTIPYIALQLKAMASSLDVLMPANSLWFGNVETPDSFASPLLGDPSIPIIIVLAVFTILFGTRHADATEHQYGLILAIAIESAIKLAAFLGVGLFVTYFMFDGFSDLYSRATNNSAMRNIIGLNDIASSLVIALLSLLAFLLLPRQFHVTVVENHSDQELKRARWLFPLYLVLINLFVIPIAIAGTASFGSSANADSFVLTLPQSLGNEFVTLIAFIGGLSAGTAMVIVASLALAIMISNHIVLPIYLRGEGYNIRLDRTNMEQRILNIRRTAILVILLLAFAYYKAADNSQALASIGLVSFAAIAQLAPAFFGGLYWRGGNSRGAAIGMMLGIIVWAYMLLLPTLSLDNLLFAIEMPEAEKLFGFSISPLANGVLWSLAFNTAGYVLGSLSHSATPLEERQASLFVEYRPDHLAQTSDNSGLLTGQLTATIARYLGTQRTQRALERHFADSGRRLEADDIADSELVHFGEDLLASAIGVSSSRLVFSLLLQRFGNDKKPHIDLLNQASKAIEYNYGVLQTAFEQLDHGITIFDRGNRLAFWNRQFRTLLDLPASIGQAGISIEEIAGQISGKHRQGKTDKSFDNLTRRLLSENKPFGLALPALERILEVRASPMPDGGRVIAWHDLTERIMVSEALRDANETLEKRVDERTFDLVQANQQLEKATRAADRANQSKTRFLSAAGHDLLQPLNAARLYTSSLIEAAKTGADKKLAGNISKSLESVEEILGSVLAISRLDSADPVISISSFPIQKILDQVEVEFRPAAQEKNLELIIVPSTLWARSDPAYLRRLLQNLVSNAIKYTPEGKVLIGCRRHDKKIRVEIIDTGIGIADKDQKQIFAEFKRLDAGVEQAPGLGLGLSIVERITKLLGHEFTMRSQPEKGSRFCLTLQSAEPKNLGQKAARKNREPNRTMPNALEGLNVVCIDNDPSILDGMTTLLSKWGCNVHIAANGQKAVHGMAKKQFKPQIALVDFHLDKDNGLEAGRLLRKNFDTELPVVLVTADRSAGLKTQAEEEDITVLNKPVRPAALRAILVQALSPRIAAE